MGKGTYGAVAAFRDADTGQEVAIKKIPNSWANATEAGPRQRPHAFQQAKRCLREVKLLKLGSVAPFLASFQMHNPICPKLFLSFSELFLQFRKMLDHENVIELIQAWL